ncbi:MAG: hypothetical protein DWC08_03010 [Candidatus Poseidoniales archaeon]|nr:MAG: hypothetical protein DWC08_03010 [Candidatus Poseidoniales archaeon]
MRDAHMSVRTRTVMSEQKTSPGENRKDSKEFTDAQSQLMKEDSLLWMMKEQFPSMMGMMFMFILTIAISLYIRPWYDIADLQAYGTSGARQVRYILLQLTMIFIFTAGILLLAKYKKEWVIKYGIMGVLAIALLYATVPLTHVMVLDLEVDPFEYESDSSIEMSYLTHHGMDTHITNSLIGVPTMWNDTINVYHGDGFNSNLSSWTTSHKRLPYDDTSVLTAVVSDEYYSFTNQAYIWYVDAETGETVDEYNCHRYMENGDDEPYYEPLGQMSGVCSLAFHADDAMYVVDEANNLLRYNTFESSPGNLSHQATWMLPYGLETHMGVLYSELIDENKVLIVTPTVAIVVELEQSSGIFNVENSDIYDDAKLLFELNATSNFTSVDFGHSPWSKVPLDESNGQEGLLLLGEENGDVHGYEWNESDEVFFEPQTRMKMLGYSDSIQSVRITDLDQSQVSDMVVVTEDEAHWLYGQTLQKLVTYNVAENVETTWYSHTDNASSFNAVYENDTIEIASGPVDRGMWALNGLQLATGPLLAALMITTILMILLYVHSEWYVVNTVGVLVGSGVIVMLGVTFVPTLIIVFMIAAAVYDAWAVYRSKHMLDLADTMIGLRLPILLVAPQEKGYSFIDETVSMKQKNEAQPAPPRPMNTSQPKKKKGKDAMFMGLGDVIFPGMLVLSAAQYIEGSEGFQIAMTTLLGGLIGYFVLMTYVARGRAQAGLPLLNGGAILGYVIGGMLLVGTAIFDFGITL